MANASLNTDGSQVCVFVCVCVCVCCVCVCVCVSVSVAIYKLGDILDRGDGERHCMDLLFKLRDEARAAGGQVHVLLGNHEVIKCASSFPKPR